MEDQEFDLRSILGLLRRQFRLILVTVILVVAGAAVAVFALKPVYTASTLVLVDPSRKNLLDPEAQFTGGASDSARVDSEVELVKSETVLLRVVKDAGLLDDPEFGVKLGLRDTILAFLRIAQPTLPTGDEALQSVVGKLRDAITAQRRGLTYLISIQAKSLSPQNAARIANAVAELYIKEQLEAKVDATLASRDIIEARVTEASDAVTRSEGAFDDFISTNIDIITAQTGRTDIAALRQQLDELDAARSSEAAVAELVARSLSRRDWQAVADSLKSEAVTALQRQRDVLQRDLAGAVDGTQRAIDLRAELGKLDAQLDASANAELTTMRQRIAAAQAQASDLRVQLRASVLDSNLPSDILTSMYALQQNAEIARTQYQTLLSRLKELEAQAYLQVPDSRIVSIALPPNEPSFPNPRLILALAGIAALGLGIGLAFLVENFVGGFTSEGQVQSVLKTNVASTVPRQKEPKSAGRGDGASLADYVTGAPLSVFAEAVRRVRLGLEQAIRRARGRVAHAPAGGGVILVTSAAPGEGKTTLALSLARAYALAGRSTLLIDCDLRKPGIHRQLGLEPSSGLLEYLTHTDNAPTLSSIVTVDEGSGAQVIVGSRRSDVATDQLLAGATFARLIRAAQKTFDVVILDTPPIGPVVDGLYLAQFADTIAFIIRWAKTSQQDARSAIASLQEAKRPETEIVTILNQQDASKSSYRSKYAGYYTEA